MQEPRLKIIVAEDSELQRLYLCSLINGLGYEAIEAEDGQMALDLISSTEAPIVISDLQMPKLDGIALTRKIRDAELGHYVHVIMLTEVDGTENRKDALQAGVDDFITKGSSTELLRARLRTAVRLAKHAAQLAQRSRSLQEANARIERDLRAAAEAQEQLLPDLHDDIVGFRVASAFMPSAIVSGDMFGCFELNTETLAFYAVDVSGHGVHASLLSVAIGHLITPDYIRTHAFDADGQPNPAAMASVLNDRFGAFDNDAYFTMFCGIINSRTGQMHYCQAGSPSAIYVRACGDTTELGEGGFPIGMLNDLPYETRTHQFEAGAALIICSDAVCEAESPASEPFGTARLEEIARTFPAVGADKIPNELVDALATWRSGLPLEDDLTVLALERKVTDDTHVYA